MGIIIGIDVGISTTKIVGIKDGKVVSPMRITAADPVTSLYGAFGKYLYENKVELSDVEQVMLTGVGSAYIDKEVYGLPTAKADEFLCDGLGAKFESGLDHIIVVSMGTGTSLVLCDGDEIRHIGGISIGGGTLQGLSRIMLQTSDIKQVSALAMHGDLANVNLLIGDISAKPLPGLPMNATASLFGNADTDSTKEDIALGIIHMVLQAIGSTAVTHDPIGNLKTDGTWTFTWQHGRQLQKMVSGSTTVQFEYNEDGLRTKKTAGSTVTNYTLHGTNIVHLTRGSDTLHFYYDAQNKPAIVIFNGTAYGYLYNLQGDVVALVNTSGTKVVEYTYTNMRKQIDGLGVCRALPCKS